MKSSSGSLLTDKELIFLKGYMDEKPKEQSTRLPVEGQDFLFPTPP
jgi:hypothetical protein